MKKKKNTTVIIRGIPLCEILVCREDEEQFWRGTQVVDDG